MEVVETTGREDLALVYVARTEEGKTLEFVEALVPPHTREEKWVLIISSLYGCPVGCLMCDSGLHYEGIVSESDLLAQIDHMLSGRFSSRKIGTKKLKVHFARMGDPAFNPNVTNVLSQLMDRFDAPGLIPCISTIAPCGTDAFFDELLEVRKNCYSDRDFQLQFSIHTTDIPGREELIPVSKWDFSRIARYGEEFHGTGGGSRKVTLNFAASTRYPVDPLTVSKYFDPEVFIIKITPLNPGLSTDRNSLDSLVSIQPGSPENQEIVRSFEDFGFDVVLSIGEPEENLIRSNCGLRVMALIPQRGA
jgi:23S rRNA (adenine2503-C2)-methyltransferase